MTLMLEHEDNGRLSQPLRAARNSRERARRMGAFLTQSLEYLGMGREDFAGRLGLDNELVDSILAGLFPLSKLDDELLSLMAYHLRLDEQVLRAFRDPNAALPPLPDVDDESETVTARHDIFATLHEFQAEGSEDSLRSLDGVLDDFREGKPVEPRPEVYEPLELHNVIETLLHFRDDEFAQTP